MTRITRSRCLSDTNSPDTSELVEIDYADGTRNLVKEAGATVTDFDYDDGSGANKLHLVSETITRDGYTKGRKRCQEPNDKPDAKTTSACGTDNGLFKYVWDAENRLIEIAPVSPSDGDIKLVFDYDYMSRRVRTADKGSGVFVLSWHGQFNMFGYEDGTLRFDDQYEYVWDAENRLIEIATRIDLGGYFGGPDEGDKRLRFEYDHMGRRTSVETTGTAFSGSADQFDLFGHNDRGELTSSNRCTGSCRPTPDPGDEVTAERRLFNYDPTGNP